MKITSCGVVFTDFVGASPCTALSTFTDREGATLLVDTAALVRMYELCKVDLERRGTWGAVMWRVNRADWSGHDGTGKS